MPVIITAHIAHSRSRCRASHRGVIIQALVPVIGPYMSRAATTSQIQHTSGSTILLVLAWETNGRDDIRWGLPAEGGGCMSVNAHCRPLDSANRPSQYLETDGMEVLEWRAGN